MGLVHVRVSGQDTEEAARRHTEYHTDFLPRKGEMIQLQGQKLARVAEVIHPLRQMHLPVVVVPLLIVNLIDEETCGEPQNG